MKTEELIEWLKELKDDKASFFYGYQIIDEIINRLEEHDELKQMLKSIVYIVSDFGCIDDFGNFIEL